MVLQNPQCWPLPAAPVIHRRYRNARFQLQRVVQLWGRSAALLTGQADALTPQPLVLEATRMVLDAPSEGGNGNTRTQTAAHG